MSIPLSDVIIPTFLGGLRQLSTLLDKAAAHTEAKKLEPDALMNSRLYPDMFTFTRQIQSAADVARRGTDRLVGNEASSVEDNESSLAQLAVRVKGTIEHVNAADRAAIDASIDREFTLDMGVSLDFTGRTYVMRFAIPNFLFHCTTAYAILRHNGVEVGKRDYIAPFMMG